MSAVPRIRTIKPQFFSSPDMAGADPWVRLLYIAMWCWADDHGRGTASPAEIGGFAFGIEGDSKAPANTELPRMLTEVQNRFSVDFYKVGGRPYFAIPTWDDHQRNERRAASKFPAPEEGTPYVPDGSDQRKRDETDMLAHAKHGSSAQTHGSSVQSRGSSVLGIGEEGKRGTGEPPSGVVRARASAGAREAPSPAGVALPAGRLPATTNAEPAIVDQDIRADHVVAAWVDTQTANGVAPTKRQIGQVAAEAKELLGKGNDPTRVLKAAIDAGSRGYGNIGFELSAMSGKPIPRSVASKPTRDDKVRALMERAKLEREKQQAAENG